MERRFLADAGTSIKAKYSKNKLNKITGKNLFYKVFFVSLFYSFVRLLYDFTLFNFLELFLAYHVQVLHFFSNFIKELPLIN